MKQRMLITMVVILLSGLMLLFSSCGRTVDAVESDDESIAAHDSSDKPTKPGASEEPSQDRPGSSEDTPGESSETPDEESWEWDNGIHAFSDLAYKISITKYENGNTQIVYPELSGLGDKKIEDKLNGFIREDAMKLAKDYDGEADTLEVNFMISWAGENLLSIQFYGYANYADAAHPNNYFYTTNLNLTEASRIRVADAVKVSDDFARFFVANSHYAGPLDGEDANLQEMLQEYIQAVDGAFLEKADTDEPGNECYCYFTPDSLGISISVPHVIADYAQYEIKYDEITSFINRQNVIWKDFPQSLSANGNAVNDSVYENIQSFIPENYKIAEDYDGEALKTGDLNKDGLSDAAFIVEGPQTADQAPERILMVALGKADNTYTLEVTAKDAILRADEGGMMGDPLESIEIKKGSLFLHFSGGSSWRWYYSYQFRYQDGDWYLIGATEGSYHASTPEETITDYNLLTGDYIISQTSEDGKASTSKGNFDKRHRYRLTDFDPRDGSVFQF